MGILRLIELIENVKGPPPSVRIMRKRTFQKFSKQSFIQNIKDVKWFDSVYPKDNVDEAVVWMAGTKNSIGL